MSLLVEGLRNTLAGPFTFSLAAGQCLAITGASGSGKTVLLRMIADLDPHDGRVVFAGTDRAAMPAPAWRRLASLVLARSGWWDETVAAHFVPAQDMARRALAADLLLPETLFTRAVEEASTGERQRLALMRALLAEPRLLLLDEPTASLDPVATEAVEQLISRRRASGTTVVWVTHDAAQASRVSDLALRMLPGGVLVA